MTGISEMTKDATLYDDDHAIIEAGYKPQLKRSIGFFSSFAVSFSFMSILLGVFSAYGFVLTKAGPFGIWTWPLVGIGQTFVALVFAEMAGRIPLTGALYNWNSQLVNPAVGWLTAWILFFTYSIAYVGVITAMLAPLQTLLGVTFDDNTKQLIGIGIFVSLALINIYGVSLAAHANKFAVIAEMVALVVFGAILLGVLCIRGEVHLSLLTTIPTTDSSYWPGFLMASLLGAWTIFGFESPADLSEETVDVRTVTPKSIVSSVVVTTVVGFVFLFILTVAIPDVAAVTAASDPISTIFTHHLGDTMTRLFLVFVIVAILASAIVGVTAASRILFAVARDKRLPCAHMFAQVSSHHVPKIAILVVMVIQIAAFLLFSDITDLFAAPTILLTLAYLITVCGFVFGVKKLPPSRHFSLGRWHRPVVIMAIVWLIGELAILTIPQDFHTGTVIAGGILIVGILFYFVTGRSNKTA